MDEIRAIHDAVDPAETLFVVDSMTGQDAANTAKAFNDALPLSGVVLTKIDGDARGGAALSVRHITGKPIKFIGSGGKNRCTGSIPSRSYCIAHSRYGRHPVTGGTGAGKGRSRKSGKTCAQSQERQGLLTSWICVINLPRWRKWVV